MSKTDNYEIYDKLRVSTNLVHLLRDTLEDLVKKRITPREANSRANVARSLVDVKRMEIYAANKNLSSPPPVAFTDD